MKRSIISITLLITLLTTSYFNFDINSHAKDYSQYYFTDFESNLADSKFVEIKNEDDLVTVTNYELNWYYSNLDDLENYNLDIAGKLAKNEEVLSADVVIRKQKYPHMLEFVAPNNIPYTEIEKILSKYDTTHFFGYKFSDEYRKSKFDEKLASWKFSDGTPLTYDFLRTHFDGPEIEFTHILPYMGARYNAETLFQHSYMYKASGIFCHRYSRYYVRFKNEEDLKQAKDELKKSCDINVRRSLINELIPIEENAIVVSYNHHPFGNENNTEVMTQLKELLKEYNLKITDSDLMDSGKTYVDAQNVIIENIEPEQFDEVFNLVENFVNSIKIGRNLYHLHITTKDCALVLNKEIGGGNYPSGWKSTGEYFRVDNKTSDDVTATKYYDDFLDAVVKYGDDAYIYPLEPEWEAHRVYRAYNPNTGEHLFTSNEREYNNLATKGWKREGVAFSSVEELAGKKTEVYRVYNPNAKGGDHHYTKSKKEAEKLVKKGWKMDNKGKPVFYGNGSKEVYRLYNKNDGRHHYTSKKSEKNKLVKLGWKDEGIGWSAVE